MTEIENVVSVSDTLVKSSICLKNADKCANIERVDVGVQTSVAEIVDFGGQSTLNTKVDRNIQTDTIKKM